MIQPKAAAIALVAAGSLTIAGGLAAAGFSQDDSAMPETSPFTASGALAPPPAAPVETPDGASTPESTLEAPTDTREASATASPAPSTATATREPEDEPEPTEEPSSSPTSVPATAATAVPTATATASPSPTPPPTQPPAPTATAVPPTPTSAPPTATAVPPTATPTQPPPPPPQSVSLSAMESAMFDAHNQQRAANGLSPLVIDSQLVDAARQRSQNMANANCFSHTACGPTAFDLLANVGFVYQIAGENIARNNYPDAQTVSVAMNGFMNSPSHRANILEPNYTRVGIGSAVSGDMKYFTVIFSGP